MYIILTLLSSAQKYKLIMKSADIVYFFPEVGQYLANSIQATLPILMITADLFP